MSGQAVVEFALVLPVLLSLLLAVIGAGLLFLRLEQAQNSIGVLAQLAARSTDDSWRNTVSLEDQRTGCHAGPLQPELAYPYGTADPRIELAWTCHYTTPLRWPFDQFAVTLRAEGVRP